MSIILGFGKTEQQVEAELESRIFNHIAFEYAEQKLDYFTDEFKAEMCAWIDKQGIMSREQGDEYKASKEPPERYTYFYPRLIGDASYLVAIVKFHHINRRHPYSPDGWALMMNTKLFLIDNWEVQNLARAA